MIWSRFMSPFISNDRPSLHVHFSEPSGTGSTFASFAGFGLRLKRRFGCGAFALAVVFFVAVVLDAWAEAFSEATISVEDNAPTTATISSFFMTIEPFSLISINRARPAGTGAAG